MSCMTPQYDDYVWLFMIYVWGCMMRDDIKWCIHTYDEYMICLMYDIIWILNDSYGIWRAYATHLNDVYDIAWVLMIHMLYDMCMLRNSNDALWYVYETVHPYDVECGSYATEYPYDVCMRHLNEWVWKFNIWLRMMSNDIQMVLGKKWPIFREETTPLPMVHYILFFGSLMPRWPRRPMPLGMRVE